MVGLNIPKVGLSPFQGWSEERKRFFHQYGYDRGPGVIPPGEGFRSPVGRPKVRQVIKETDDDKPNVRTTTIDFSEADPNMWGGGNPLVSGMMGGDPSWSADTAINTPPAIPPYEPPIQVGGDAQLAEGMQTLLSARSAGLSGDPYASLLSPAPGLEFDEYTGGRGAERDEMGMQQYWQDAAQREQRLDIPEAAAPQASLDKIMDAIMMAESGGDPNAHNTSGEDSIGLFQINWDFWGRTTPIKEGFPVPYDILNNKLKPILGRDLEKADLFDPMINRQAAYAIQESEGFSPWSVYKSGKYLDFLPEGEGGTMADPKARVAGPFIDRPTGIHPDAMTPPYWAGERFPEDAPYPVPTGQDDPTGAAYGGRFETGSSDYEIEGMLNDAIRSSEATDRIGRPTFERDQFTTAGMGGFTGGSSLFDMPSDPTWSADTAINVEQTGETTDKGLLGKVGSAGQDIIQDYKDFWGGDYPWMPEIMKPGTGTEEFKNQVDAIKEKIPPDLLERAIQSALEAGISVDEYLAEKVGQAVTKATEAKTAAEPVLEQIGETATQLKEDYYDPIEAWLDENVAGIVPPASEWDDRLLEADWLPRWAYEGIKGGKKIQEKIGEGFEEFKKGPFGIHPDELATLLTETVPEYEARIAGEQDQKRLGAESFGEPAFEKFQGLLGSTADATPAEVAGEEAVLLAQDAYVEFEEDAQGIPLSAETDDAPLITPEEVGETTGRSLNESVNRIWANFPQDIEGKRERYLQALGELYKKIAILNVISALTGAPSMAPQLMELASKKFEALEGFEGEERLQDIAKGVYFTEDGRFDPPASQRDAFERAIAFGGTMEEAKTISGYMPEGEEAAKVKQYYRDKGDGTWEVFRSSVDPGPGYVEGKPAGDPPSAGAGQSDDALTKKIKKFQEQIELAKNAKDDETRQYHLGIAEVYRRHLDKEGTKESNSDLFHRLYTYYHDANKSMAGGGIKREAPTMEEWLLEDKDGKFHAKQHLGPNYVEIVKQESQQVSTIKPIRVRSQEEYDALEPGTLYKDDEGVKTKGKK